MCTHVSGLDFGYEVWSDRDMIRATLLPTWPPLGPELWYGVGARIPGGGNQLLWALALRVHDSPVAVVAAMWGLHVVGALAVGAAIRRHVGSLAAAVCITASVCAAPALRTLDTLWNPGWTLGLGELAVAATLAGLLDRRAAWAVPAAVALAFALQTHVSAALLGLALLGAWLVARPPGTGRWGAVACAAFVATYVPYIAHELGTGGANTVALLHPRQVATLSPTDETWAERATEASGILAQLVGAAGWPMPDPWAALAALALIGAALIPPPTAAARTLTGLSAAMLALTLLVYTRSVADAGHAEQARYLASVVCAFPLLLAGLVASGRPTLVGLGVAAAIGTLGGAFRLHHSLRDHALLDQWSTLTRTTDALAAHPPPGVAPGDVAEATRRTAVVRDFGGKVERFGTYSLTWPLWAAPGRTDPPRTGSGRPPCALLVVHDSPYEPARPTSPAFLAAALGTEPIAHVDAIVPLDGTHTLLHYTPTSDWCPTDFEQRYFDPDELSPAAPRPDAPRGAAVRIPTPAGRAWAFTWQSRLDKDDVWPEGTLTVGDESVTLHAGALSGRGWNLGRYANAAVVAPTLIARDAQGIEVARVVLATGVVGGTGAHTPLTVGAQLPRDATLELTFTSDVGRIPWEDGAGRTDLAVPVRLQLP